MTNEKKRETPSAVDAYKQIPYRDLSIRGIADDWERFARDLEHALRTELTQEREAVASLKSQLSAAREALDSVKRLLYTYLQRPSDDGKQPERAELRVQLRAWLINSPIDTQHAIEQIGGEAKNQ